MNKEGKTWSGASQKSLLKWKNAIIPRMEDKSIRGHIVGLITELSGEGGDGYI